VTSLKAWQSPTESLCCAIGLRYPSFTLDSFGRFSVEGLTHPERSEPIVPVPSGLATNHGHAFCRRRCCIPPIRPAGNNFQMTPVPYNVLGRLF